MRQSGHYQRLGSLEHFIPFALPPKAPPLVLSSDLLSLYGEASFALGQLNEMSQRLPDPMRFMKAYAIKEALLSSAIEGIHTTLIDVFASENQETKINKETQLVINHTRALNSSLDLIKQMPLVSRVILAAHQALLGNGKEDAKAPGSYRKQSVSVGDLIPPPAPEVSALIADLEKYINEPSELPALIKAGLVHVQFETIHPFLDGNGRIGRLLIVLMLIDSGLLSHPILYPSYFFKKHHLEYYQRLDAVRTQGDYEGWVVFYLKAIRDSSFDAHERAKEIEALEASLKKMIQHDAFFKKMRETAELILSELFAHPVTSITELKNNTGKAYNTVAHVLNSFVEIGFVSENVLNKRNKIYRFDAYLDLLDKNYLLEQ